MSQNRSHAVMSQRVEAHDSLDHFPTPSWATRALCEHVLKPLGVDMGQSFAWEPAAAEGAMVRPLAEHFKAVHASDIRDYGAGFEIGDFLFPGTGPSFTDWIITNPPFRLGEQFARRAISIAREGVALLVRTAFLESQDRFRLYSDHPPAVVAQFVERVPMVKGRLERSASTATAYCWIVWRRGATDTRFKWIPPCKAKLDRDTDWQAAA